MLKKLTSLLLALLVCLSLLPGQVRAAEVPEPIDPPAQTDPVEQEAPEEPVMPLWEEMPEDKSTGYS